MTIAPTCRHPSFERAFRRRRKASLREALNSASLAFVASGRSSIGGLSWHQAQAAILLSASALGVAEHDAINLLQEEQ